MKNSARMITFGVTCVVARSVVSHFRKPAEGMAAGLMAFAVTGVPCVQLSTLRIVLLLSNQNRHAAYI